MGLLHFSSRALFFLVAWILIQAKARQIPLSTTEHISWDFFEKPSPDSTSHLIFDTVSSFLQHWPNTRYRNGHNIVPGTIPIGTLLYHGTFREEIPRIPEWTATDPEHSYLFCVPTSEHSGCWHLTLVATRPLKVLYFDGSSAAKFPGGAMDSQDVLAWGEVKPDWTYEERKRIIDLCEWGKQYGIDGFVSEVMVCDFAAGLEVVSFHYLVPGEGPRGHKRPSVIHERQKTDNISDPLPLPTDFRVIEAGSWHNHFPGETRIHLDYAGVVSFYDTALFPSLKILYSGKERWEPLRLKGITPEDVETLWKTMGSILQGAWDRPVRSGIDWKTFLRVIVDRYTGRLRVLNHLLNSTMLESEEDITLALNKAHGLMSGMLSPYRIYSASPPEVHYDSIPKFSWAIPEICYLPTWPFFAGGPSMPDDGPDDSIKPQPRCIRRIEL
ncbi:hypothetical protein BYT27DRAFT_7195792 [Phlegmacium glaucopus]|nr:hypothetical protein BYT27DRAFT_7195792 [Phlegmacium glaucopus]